MIPLSWLQSTFNIIYAVVAAIISSLLLFMYFFCALFTYSLGRKVSFRAVDDLFDERENKGFGYYYAKILSIALEWFSRIIRPKYQAYYRPDKSRGGIRYVTQDIDPDYIVYRNNKSSKAPFSWNLMDWCLRVAFFYPLIFMLIGWSFNFGESASLGTIDVLPERTPDFAHITSIGLILAWLGSIVYAKRQYRYYKEFQEKPTISSFLPRAAPYFFGLLVAVFCAMLSYTAGVQSSFSFNSGLGRHPEAFAVSVAAIIALAVSRAGNVVGEFSWKGAFSVGIFAALGVGIVFFVGLEIDAPDPVLSVALPALLAFLFAIGVDYILDQSIRSSHEQLGCIAYIALVILLIGVLYVIVPFIGKIDNFHRVVIVFLVVLPLVNAFFDFLSIGMTRYFLGSSLKELGMGPDKEGQSPSKPDTDHELLGEKNGKRIEDRDAAQIVGKQIYVIFKNAIKDILAATVTFVLLALSIVFVVSFLESLTEACLIRFTSFLNNVQDNPENYYWLYATIFSTFIPTVFHTAIGIGAVVLRFSPTQVKHQLYRWVKNRPYDEKNVTVNFPFSRIITLDMTLGEVFFAAFLEFAIIGSLITFFVIFFAVYLAIPEIGNAAVWLMQSVWDLVGDVNGSASCRP